MNEMKIIEFDAKKRTKFYVLLNGARTSMTIFATSHNLLSREGWLDMKLGIEIL